MNEVTEDELNEIAKECIERYGIILKNLTDRKTKVENMTITELTNLNKYFIQLQNKYLLTPLEERLWAKVSLKLNGK